jgi:hypothetical protein
MEQMHGRRRSSAYEPNRLNRSLAPDLKSDKLVRSQFRISTGIWNGALLSCYPIRIANVYAPPELGHMPSCIAVLNWVLTRRKQTIADNGVVIASVCDEADGLFCVDLGYQYPEEALLMWTADGSWNFRHPWRIYPVTAVRASPRCIVYPSALTRSPMDLVDRKHVLDRATQPEARINVLDHDKSTWPSYLANQNCLDQMDMLMTHLISTGSTMPSKLADTPEHAMFSCVSKEEHWELPELNPYSVQYDWPCYPGDYTPQASTSTPPKRNHFHSSSVTLPPTSGITRMLPRQVAQARRATRKRATDLYSAWHSNKLPIPPVPVVRPDPVQASAVETRREKNRRKATRRLQNKMDRNPSSGQADLHNEAPVNELQTRRSPEEKDIDLLDIWDWYEACLPFIESLVSQRAQPGGAPWVGGFEWLEDEVIVDYVVLDSYAALEEQFSAACRFIQLYGEEYERVMRKVPLPRPVHRLSGNTIPLPNNDSGDNGKSHPSVYRVVFSC